jgi:hypothetical protein
MQGGQRLIVQAAATPQTLSAGSQRAADAELVLLLEAPQRKAAGLVIGPADSHAFDGDRRWPIAVPRGFRWQESATGLLTPDYA